MISKMKNRKIVFLSTYPPRECGLATFTQDLINAIDSIGKVQTKVIAISNTLQNNYDHKVENSIRQNERRDYIELALKLNISDTDILVIEHEYGIFGGEYGEYILDLVLNLKIPLITTFHTILQTPNLKQRYIVKTLADKSEKIVTMASNTKLILQSVYGVNPDTIEVIHHGVPKRLIQSREQLKKELGFENKQLISTFGLIGPGKGLEYGIEAIAKVASDNPDILYLILGQTHPALKEEGQVYRNKLEELIEKHSLKQNIRFINKYLSKDEIIQYLQLSDIYMTPYLGPDQAVSGTLAYAVGYGKAIVSTPYLYAKEMLADGRGLLAKFNDADSLADCIKYILQNPDEKANMEHDTLKLGMTMYWDQVAKCYTEVFLGIMKENLLACKRAINER